MINNIAELLKDAPKGMKLYSPLFGEVKFVRIDKQSGYPIVVTDCKGNGKSFTEFGVYFSDHPDAECLLFPSKDCRTWKGWKLPVEPKFNVGDWLVYKNGNCFAGGFSEAQVVKVEKDVYFFASGTSGSCKFIDENCRLWRISDAIAGDVLTDYADGFDNPLIFILKGFEHVDFGLKRPSDYSSYCFLKANTRQDFLQGQYHHKHDIKPATKEQRDLLFAKMKEAGYEWDAEKKELRKIKPNYDIASFKPFDKVLVRDSCCEKWAASLFSNYDDKDCIPHHFMCIDSCYTQCIPFEGNERLLGTTDMPSEEFINW